MYRSVSPELYRKLDARPNVIKIKCQYVNVSKLTTKAKH